MSNRKFVLLAVVFSLAGSVLVFLGVGQLLADHWQVETSRLVPAPPARVAALIGDLATWEQWSAVDFNLGTPTRRSVTGQAGTVGHSAAWEGPMGRATLAFTKVADNAFDFSINYEFAHDGGVDHGRLSGRVSWRAEIEGEVAKGSVVTWSEYGRLDTLIARWSSWFGALQEHVKQVQGASLGGLERALREP